MGSLAHRLGLVTLTALGLHATVATVSANEIQARADGLGLWIVGPDQVLSDYCSKEADGTLWLHLPGGAVVELVTSTSDPDIANPGDGSFHSFDENEVRAALADVRYPLQGLNAEILILPFPRRGSLESAAAPGLILLSPGVADMPAERQHAEVVHELGHVVQYLWFPDTDARWTDYRVRRGIADATVYSASSPHADRPHEIFAEDFRALFGGAKANYSGSIENSALVYPALVPGLDAFILSLPRGVPAAVKLMVGANPARGPVSFALATEDSGPLDLFDVSGRRIATIEPMRGTSGSEWRWDGRDAAGHPVPPGVLLARLRGGQEQATRFSWLP